MNETTKAWQPIATIPPVGIVVVACFPKKFFALTCRFGPRFDRNAFTTHDGNYHEPTHWLALPEKSE